jgi:hypothetical protein
MEAIERLELLTSAYPGEAWGITPGEMYSPSKAKEGEYTKRLKQALAAHPPTEEGAEKPRKDKLTDRQKIAAIRSYAAKLLEQQTPFSDRLPLLRAHAQELYLTLRDQELQRFIWDARRAAAGGIEPLGPGDVINLSPTPWHWEEVLMADCLNLLTGLPKCGKTSLLLALIGAWQRGKPSFLGHRLVGPCPPVLIVGTDQPESDWGRMLREVGLLGAKGEILPPIVGLFHKGRPLHLDCEGIERIASYAAKHPGLLSLLDSISACTSSLGLDENSAEIVEPINDLMEAISPHGATLVAIHHSSKGRQGENASLASRGSTALPAAASQVIALARLASPPAIPPERRVLLKTEGRGGMPQQLLIERTEEGWISHGDAEAVAQAQALQEAEEKLTDRQADALEVVRERWARGAQRTDANALGEDLGLRGEQARKARSTLDQLARKGLLQWRMETSLQGRIKWFWPVGSEPSRGGLSDGSYPSEPSYPPLSEEEKEPSSCKGSEASEGKEVKKGTPRESLLTSKPHAAIPCRVNGQPGWTRPPGPMRGPSFLVTDPAGRSRLVGRDEISEPP